MTLYRCFAWRREASEGDPDGPLWFPTIYQGEGRHDNPSSYGCLYLADRPVSCVVEQLAAFRGQRLTAALLRRRGLPLALAEIELHDSARLLDLDDPMVLGRARLRPSRVATRDRTVTQPQALTLYRRHAAVVGLQWWSSWEGLWVNTTLFDRARPSMRLAGVRELGLDDPVVAQAADFFGLRLA